MSLAQHDCLLRDRMAADETGSEGSQSGRATQTRLGTRGFQQCCLLLTLVILGAVSNLLVSFQRTKVYIVPGEIKDATSSNGRSNWRNDSNFDASEFREFAQLHNETMSDGNDMPSGVTDSTETGSNISSSIQVDHVDVSTNIQPEASLAEGDIDGAISTTDLQDTSQSASPNMTENATSIHDPHHNDSSVPSTEQTEAAQIPETTQSAPGPLATPQGGSNNMQHLAASQDGTILYIPSTFSQVNHVHNGLSNDIGGPNISYYPFADCKATSRVRLISNNNVWQLQSMDDDGADKTVGGDEYYVTFHEYKQIQDLQNKSSKPLFIPDTEPLAIARVIDNHNGLYTLDFYNMPTPMRENPDMLYLYNREGPAGYLTVHFQYTCGIGFLPRNYKQNWTTGGSSHVTYTEVISQPPPVIRPFAYPPASINFTQYDMVLAFGDSLMGNLVFYKNGTLFRSKTFLRGNIRSALTLESVPKFVSRIRQFHRQVLTQTEKIALLLGSSTWDIIEDFIGQGTTFDDHAEALRQLIPALRSEYPRAVIHWRMPSAMHIHRIPPLCLLQYDCNQRIRYISTSRTEHLYRRQLEVVTELNVTKVDFYEAYYAAAHMSLPGDGRHYNEEFNKMVMDWMYH
jgi:hypothetical protein